MGQLWTDKYAPKNLGQIVGNSEALAKIKSWALDWQRGKKLAPLMLYGPPGVGKTATVRALAEEMGWALVETNASDLRDGQTMKKLLGAASGASTLYGGIRLVLIDEVDAALDRGQVPELNKVLTEALQPILLTANDLWEPKITPLRALCTKIEFKKVSKAEVRKRLEAVLLAENCSHDLAPYLDNAQGDVRAALLDLQAGVPGLRERQINVFEGIRRVFKAKTFKESLSAQDDSAVDLDLFLRWIEENIPAEYESAEEVADAFDKMSRADVFSGRIRKRQAWGLLKFVRALALGGVAGAKKKPYYKFTPYQYPGIIRGLGQSKQNRALSKSAWQKAGKKLHLSTRKARQDAYFYAGFGKAFGWNEEENSVATRFEHLVHHQGKNDDSQEPKKVRGKKKAVQV